MESPRNPLPTNLEATDSLDSLLCNPTNPMPLIWIIDTIHLVSSQGLGLSSAICCSGAAPAAPAPAASAMLESLGGLSHERISKRSSMASAMQWGVLGIKKVLGGNTSSQSGFWHLRTGKLLQETRALMKGFQNGIAEESTAYQSRSH